MWRDKEGGGGRRGWGASHSWKAGMTVTHTPAVGGPQVCSVDSVPAGNWPGLAPAAAPILRAFLQTHQWE